MVVFQSKKPYFGIVDGQQRLTTITIILSSLRNAFMSLGEEDLARGIHKFIEQPNIDYVNEFVLNTQTSFPYLQNEIQSFEKRNLYYEVGPEEKNLEIAFELIKLKIQKNVSTKNPSQKELFSNDNEDITWLKEVRDKVLSLKLVFIQLDNEDDAYLIFETLNARGRDLRTSDLVKNLILKTKKSNNANLDHPKEQWNSIVNRFTEIEDKRILESFILHYWISKYNHTTEKNLFSEIKKFVKEDYDKITNLLEELNHYSKIYYKIVAPKLNEWKYEEVEIKESLIALNIFKVKQDTSFVLSLLNAYDHGDLSRKNTIYILKRIEHFHLLFNGITSQRSGGVIAKNYSDYAIKLSKAGNDNDKTQRIFHKLELFLSFYIPTEEEFYSKFVQLTFLSNRDRNKALIKYILVKLSGEEISGLNIDYSSLTIEHLIPESEIKNGTDENIIGNMGNLILINSKTNSEKLRDKSSQEKYRILLDIKYPIERNFIPSNHWDKDFIEKRCKSISDFIYNYIKFKSDV